VGSHGFERPAPKGAIYLSIYLYLMKQTSLRAFTLVELIVVITILAIL
jgi:prepilin-type N-terminal cleavage/methylation domain-containing protein